MLSTCENAWLVPHAKLEGISLMDHLFGRLNGMYPNKWRANFRDEQAIHDWKAAWAEAFDEDGITPQDVAAGIKNCRRMYDWPPSLVEFLKACRPSLDAETAFHVAVKGMAARRKGEVGTWPHPAVFWAAAEIGQYDMLAQSWQTLKSRWSAAYSVQLSSRSWGEIPVPAAALPAPGQTVASKDQVDAGIKAMAAAAIEKTRDPKVWARKILANPKGRSPSVVSMAKRVLEQTGAV